MAAMDVLPPSVRARFERMFPAHTDSALRNDDRLMKVFGEVQVGEAMAVLEEYEASTRSGKSIKNKAAYLIGILRKYQNTGRVPMQSPGRAQAPMAYPPQAPHRVPMGTMPAAQQFGGITEIVKNTLDQLYLTGFIRHDDLDQRSLDYVSELTEDEALAALLEFKQSEINGVRNKSAFLMSMLRKYQGQGPSARPPQYGPPPFQNGRDPVGQGGPPPYMAAPAPQGHGGGNYPPPFESRDRRDQGPSAGVPFGSMSPAQQLSPEVRRRLEQLFFSGFCQPADIDERCMGFLASLAEPDAIHALEELGAQDRRDIRKIPAFFMGVMKKHAGQSGDRTYGPAFGSSDSMLGKRGRDDGPYNNGPGPKQMRGNSRLPSLPYMPDMSERVYHQLQVMVANGVLPEAAVDERLVASLGQLNEGAGFAALDEFSACDLGRVRNLSAYLMGVIKRYKDPSYGAYGGGPRR